MSRYQFAILLYGIFCLALGVEAYAVKHHLASLLGGGTIGVIEIMLAAYVWKNPRVAYISAAVLGLATAGMFIGQMAQAHELKLYPSLLMVVVSLGFVGYLGSAHMGGKAKKAAH